MGKASSSKKVARVARTGGGRTKRGQATSWFWPVFIGFVVVLGTTGIVYSRDQREPDNTRPRAGAPGRPGDHWHAAIGFDICGNFAPNVADNGQDPLGIHSHGDGVVHIHPFSGQSAGKNAKLKVWLDTVGVKLTDNELKLPGQDAKKNGGRCEAGPATLQMKVWDSRAPTDTGRVITNDFGDLRVKDSQLITVAYLPEGAEIPKPPSEGELDRLTDVGTAASSTTVAPTTSTPSTTAPAPTTSLPASSSVP
jgi:hypothetical protein